MTDAGDLVIRTEHDLRADGRPDMGMGYRGWSEARRGRGGNKNAEKMLAPQ